MKLEIERMPDFALTRPALMDICQNQEHIVERIELLVSSLNSSVQKHWRTHVEPVKKLLSEGVEYYQEDECKYWYIDKQKYSTRKALLINITEIKKQTREEKLEAVLRDLKSKICLSKLGDEYSCGFNNSNPKEIWDLCQAAKKALEGEA